MAGFSTEVHTARKEYTCWTCNNKIAVGDYYACSAGTNESGAFVTTRMCIECTFLATQKTGENAETFAPGCFTERKIPNCLRKLRSEYRLAPLATIEKYGVLNIKSETPARQQIIVKTSEFNRKIFHFPESRFKLEHFPKGATITVKAGVNGKSRQVTIKGAWSTDGSAFSSPNRQIAILTEPATVSTTTI